ncbi:MAG: glycosyltransferase [Salinarimonadaceae bacterium]|nr:MAG: glycosyltransferase [Salinarimonadaceae bacterium]
MSAPALMFVSSSDYDGLIAKGVTGMIAERSEGGFFRRVISLHPLARKTRVVPIAPGHDLVELGFDALPGGSRSRALRLLYAPLYVARAALAIRRIVREEGVDVVRASDPYWGALVAWLGTRSGSARFVISIHADWDHLHALDPRNGAPKLFGSRKASRLLARFLLSRAERVMCIRKSLFAPAERAGARRERLRLIPHGVNLAPFRAPAPPPPDDLAPGRRIVFFAGRLSRENYVDDVFEAGRRLARRGDVALVLAGGGPEEERLRAALAGDPELTQAICFLGFIPRDEVLALRRAAAVNLVPMGGYSLIEACASGRPTIAYDVQWHSELIEDGASGRLVPEGDVDGLVAGVEAFLDDPDLADRIGAAGRARAFALHDIEKVFLVRAGVYRELLEETP